MIKIKEEKKKNNKEGHSKCRWYITAFGLTFFLSLFFSYISTTSITNLSLIPAIIILIVVIFIGVVFDIIGVAVTVADEESFHAKASKKIAGSKTAIKLIRNSARVSNICADIIGDICGVLSGAISAIIALKISEQYGLTLNAQFLLSAISASLTVGGKAIGKEIAKQNTEKIVWIVSKLLKGLYK